MSDEPIRIEVSPWELRQIMQLALNALAAITGLRPGYQPIGPFVTIDGRCNERWPLSTRDDRRRVRDVCLGMYRARLGRHPYKASDRVNGEFEIEEENLEILDHAIDVVRTEVEAREKMPLFSRQPR